MAVQFVNRDAYDAPIEQADSVAPQQIAYAVDNGKRTGDYEMQGGDDLIDRIRQIIGYNKIADPNDVDTLNNGATPGCINRYVPQVHPEDPSLFASSISLVGFGRNTEQLSRATYQPTTGGISVAPSSIAPRFAAYPKYLAKVEFALRPYHPLTNANVGVDVGRWTNEDGDLVDFVYCNEYDRFVEIDEKFDPKIVTATQGQIVFRTHDSSRPDGAAFAGQPRIPYPETTIRMMWHQVPYHYISSRNSFLKRFALRVNQLPWTVQDYFFEPGELLYLGFDYVRYTPPFPVSEQLGNVLVGIFPVAINAPSLEKWANITLNFSYAPRTSASPVPVMNNKNWIAAGHNLLPWFGPGNSNTGRRGFHYACSFDPTDRDDRRAWQPVYESAPLQVLFTDPDFSAILLQ